jgi:hypothetical protein
MELGSIIPRNIQTASGLRGFNDRFSDFKARKILIKIISSPFPVEIYATSTNLQLEVSDFQSESILKEQLYDSSLTELYSKYFSAQKILKIENMLC